MSDIIHLLPDSVANQIAAGEVIQRPSSVVKELVENSIDAGATNIKVIFVAAGRTSIQVIDNGKGMSTTDARMSFERHATSKISSADDLFELHTKGFRGEALASIAAIAHVELRTRREDDELGTLIEIAGSKYEGQSLVQAPEGTSFLVKNLFYNVPARRKFIKSDEVERRNILQEMHRIMLSHPDITFQLYNGDEIIYDALSGTLMQRIVQLFGKKSKNIAQKLIRLDLKTSIVEIEGYVGLPEIAAKNPQQYFFVNDRYMYHPYFRKAVQHAYERMLPSDMQPVFFLAMRVNPTAIDVNVHPTKTEIKFEDEKAIWSILAACVKEALGKFNIAPSIDFDMDNSITMPVHTSNTSTDYSPQSPTVSFNPNYNPFSFEDGSPRAQVSRNWESAFEIVDNRTQCNPTQSIQTSYVEQEVPQQQAIFYAETHEESTEMILYKGRFLCMAVKSGLMLIDVRRALLRIEYEEIRRGVEQQKSLSQKMLFPELIEFDEDDLCLFTEIEMDLRAMGFDFTTEDTNTISINALPSQLEEGANVQRLIDDMLFSVRSKDGNVAEELADIIAISLAKTISNTRMTGCIPIAERENLVGRLLSSSNPNYTPEGKKIITVVEDIEAMF